MARRKKKSEQEQANQFGLVLPVVLGLFAALFWFRKQNADVAVGLLVAGTAINFIAAAIPGLWLRFFRLWMKLAVGLSWVMTRVILTIFFFVILTPFVLVMRLFGKKPLDLSWNDGKTTYWIDKEPVEPTVERYRKQY